MPNMKYYQITCFTPYIGEENTYYVQTNKNTDINKHLDDFIYETHAEWYDEVECDMSAEEHEEACYAEVKELSEAEFTLYSTEWGYTVI